MRPERRPERRAEAGFTLLEALVALAVLGVVLATLLRLAGDTLAQHRSREAQLRLALTAEAVLNWARLGEDGLAGGTAPAGLAVTIERTALAAAAGAALELPETVPDDGLEWLAVTVVDEAGRSFRLAGIVDGRRQ